MIIAMCCTRNWYMYLAVELYALLKHNKVKKVYLFIEDDNIPYIKDKRVEFININKTESYINSQSPNYNTKYSKLSYVRCYFSKLINEEKIIYLDADAIVVDDISELWNMDMGDNVIIGIHEGGEWNRHLWTYGLDDTYINSGIMVMDLKKIKEEKLDDSMLYLLNNNYYAFPDQDVINLVCRNRIKYVDNRYNSTEITGFRDDAKIIHYIRGNKGWIKGSPRSEIWYNYHDKYFKEEGNMNNYKVRATKNFNDYEGRDVNDEKNPFIQRVANESEWYCSGERYAYLKQNNAVELIEIVPIEKEETKVVDIETHDEQEEDTKPKKKKTSKK